MATIHSLPAELLLEIFSLASPLTFGDSIFQIATPPSAPPLSSAAAGVNSLSNFFGRWCDWNILGRSGSSSRNRLVGVYDDETGPPRRRGYQDSRRHSSDSSVPWSSKAGSQQFSMLPVAVIAVIELSGQSPASVETVGAGSLHIFDVSCDRTTILPTIPFTLSHLTWTPSFDSRAWPGTLLLQPTLASLNISINDVILKAVLPYLHALAPTLGTFSVWVYPPPLSTISPPNSPATSSSTSFHNTIVSSPNGSAFAPPARFPFPTRPSMRLSSAFRSSSTGFWVTKSSLPTANRSRRSWMRAGGSVLAKRREWTIGVVRSGGMWRGIGGEEGPVEVKREKSCGGRRRLQLCVMARAWWVR